MGKSLVSCFFYETQCILKAIPVSLSYLMPVESFFWQFNSIMSVLGKCENEMVAIHLIKSYCLPTLMYGCEV